MTFTMALAPGYRVTPKVTLIRPLGKGAMGSVWVAEHSTLDTEVAVKFITDDFQHRRADALERFRREAKAAARIKSPHVVQMLDHGVTDDGYPYIIMEHLEGESLSDRIKRDGVLSFEETGQVVMHVCRALTAAHRLGVIHRDIKPQNIFITHIHGELFAKVLDFGIAKNTEGDRGREELTEPGTLVGTPEYLSRDLIALKGAEADEQVDHWALAVVAYKCLTGKIPFSGDTLALVLAALAVGKFEPPSTHRPDLPERFDKWFERAFHEDPDRRFASAEELAMSFAAVVNPGAAPWDHKETQVRPRVTPPPESQKVPGAVIGTAIAGLAVGIIIAFAIYDGGSASTPPLPSGLIPDAGAGGTAPAPSAAPMTSSSAADAGTADATAPPPAPPAAEGEIYIPAGDLWLGCYSAKDEACADDERPGKSVSVPGFFIDEKEVTVEAYARCVTEHGCKKEGLAGYALPGGRFGLSERCNWGRKGRTQHPINCISWVQADTYCRWAGKRLPSEVEWERAARGDDRRIFPWGDDPADCDHAVMAKCGDAEGTWEVGTQTNDKSPFGALDMAGNVREWVATWYDAKLYGTIDPSQPTGPATGELRVERGGCFANAVPKFLRISARSKDEPETRRTTLGFRCARDLDAAPKPPPEREPEPEEPREGGEPEAPTDDPAPRPPKGGGGS